MSQIDEFQIRLLRKLLAAGRRRARNYILGSGGAHKSRTLAREMQSFIQTTERGFLYVDPYWAVYFHDGRTSIVGKNLVWFKNPRLDPRRPGGRTPNRARDLRSLTKSEFRDAREKGQIIVTRRVRGVSPTPFFSNRGGMAGFRAEAGRIVQREFRRFLVEQLGEDLLRSGTISLPVQFR